MKIPIFFASSNPHKVEEIKQSLIDYPLYLTHLNIKDLEIQAEKVEEIARDSALRASRKYKIPIIVEDTGLFIDALNGFPGPYASYVYNTLNTKGILKLLDGVFNRKATFRSAVAFCDLYEKTTCFMGECFGNISIKQRGEYGFGFDPIFEPNNGFDKTFAEMKLKEKITISHRSQAVKKFAEWYIKNHSVDL